MPLGGYRGAFRRFTLDFLFFFVSDSIVRFHSLVVVCFIVLCLLMCTQCTICYNNNVALSIEHNARHIVKAPTGAVPTCPQWVRVRI